MWPERQRAQLHSGHAALKAGECREGDARLLAPTGGDRQHRGGDAGPSEERQRPVSRVADQTQNGSRRVIEKLRACWLFDTRVTSRVLSACSDADPPPIQQPARQSDPGGVRTRGQTAQDPTTGQGHRPAQDLHAQDRSQDLHLQVKNKNVVYCSFT